MDPADIKRSQIVRSGAEHVEQMRRALNGVYSNVPEPVEEVFSAALDQIADQQVKVSLALTQLTVDDNLPNAEGSIAAATDESRRNALRAARAYADYKFIEAGNVYKELSHIPTNVTELADQKRKLDDTFQRATQLHEQDNIAALNPLLEVSNGYKVWCDDARLLITGSQGIVKSDKKRIRLQWLAILVAIFLGAINTIFMIINLILNLRRK